jgi:hypothetical protein
VKFKDCFISENAGALYILALRSGRYGPPRVKFERAQRRIEANRMYDKLKQRPSAFKDEREAGSIGMPIISDRLT